MSGDIEGAIDVHAHYVPPEVIAELERDGGRYGVSVMLHPPTCQKCLKFDYGLEVRPFFPRLIESVGKRIDWMQSVGLSRQVLSIWTDIFGYALPLRQRVEWHRLLNLRLAEFCARHPQSFSWLASGALPDASEASRELRESVRNGAVGAVCATNVEGVNLGELDLDEFWATADSLDVPVFLHPAQPVPTPRTARFSLTQIAQYTFDTTCCIASLIGSGVLDRFPRLKLIASHGGGTLPFLIGRFDIMYERADRRATGMVAAHCPSEYLRRFWLDTIVHHPKVLAFVAEMIGTDRLLLGTDESFPPHEEDPVGALHRAGFSIDDIRRIGIQNPTLLFRLDA